MNPTNNKYFKSILFFSMAFFIAGCWGWTNFTTYFNTYYNADRLIDESEDEFDYYERQKRDIPRSIVPNYDLLDEKENRVENIPVFMQEFVVSKDKLQPVKVKLDSVLIKGSKILANKKDSDYLEGTLFLMAQAYFYRSEWFPCQVKCGELIDLYPEGDKSPDAHILFSKALLVQKKFYSGKKMLSRTVDIAWQLERYDILAEAFRLQADLAIYEGDEDGALRPYLQAVIQSDDGEMKAKWQIELASLLYRLNKFEKAEAAFEVAYEDYDPDYLGEFEAKLYRADCLNRLGRYEEGEEIIEELEDDGKFEEWKGFTYAMRMNMWRYQSKDSSYSEIINEKFISDAENYADTAHVGITLIMLYNYEKAIEMYMADDYQGAQKYFAKARRGRSPAFNKSTLMFKYMGDIIQKRRGVDLFAEGDSIRTKQFGPGEIAANAFEIGRIYQKLDRPDSVRYYYNKALEAADQDNPKTAKYLYAVSQVERDFDPYYSDSLLEVIVDRFPNTEIGVETMKDLGFTEAFLIDSAKELYTSGVDLRKYGEYDFAIKQFRNVAEDFPKSEYSPRSLYSAGWIFERIEKVRNIDSAVYYYRWLVREYPNTEYANEVRMGLAYLSNINDGTPIPDSLNYDKLKQTAKKPKNIPSLPAVRAPVSATPKSNVGGFNLMEINKQKFLQQTKDLLNQSIDAIKSPLNEIDSLKMELDTMKQQFDTLRNMDIDDIKRKMDPRKKKKGEDADTTDGSGD